MRTLGWVGLFLVVGLATLKFVPEQPQETVADCARDFSAGFRDTAPPGLDRYIRLGELREASRVLCVEWVAFEGKHPSGELESLAAAVRAKPLSYLPLCRVTVDFELAANAESYRFVTAPERSRYRRDHCRFAVDYFQPNTIDVDRARLAADHPALYAPLCASLIQIEVVAASLPITPRKLHTSTRRSCAEALESGKVRVGRTGWDDAYIDEAGFDAILERHGL